MHNASERAERSSKRLGIGSPGTVNGIESPEMDGGTIDADGCNIRFAAPFIGPDAFSVGAPRWPIAIVLRYRSFPEVCPAVVRPNAVDVINCLLRVLTRPQEPSHSVRWVLRSVEPHQAIALRPDPSDRAVQIVRPGAGSGSLDPAQIATLTVV